MDNILVTGGGGFIGSNLVDTLVSKGFNVFVIDNFSTGLQSNINSKVKYYNNDIMEFIHDKDLLVNIIINNKIKVVYHLAAFADVRLSITDPIECYNINHISSIAILDACKKTKIKKFIFTSTSAVYGDPSYEPVDEVHPVNPISPYGLSKLAFEQYAKYKSSKDMEMIVFRLPNVYGPRQRPDLEGGVIAIFYNLIKENKEIIFFGDGFQTRDWIHVNDIINAFILVLSNSLSSFEIMTLGSGSENTLWDVFNHLSTLFEYDKKPILRKPREGDIKTMSMSGDKAKKLLSWKAEIDLSMGLKLLN